MSAYPRTFAASGNDRTSSEKSRRPKPNSLKKVGAQQSILLTDHMTLRKSLLALTLCLFALSAFAFTETLPQTPTVANAEQIKKIEAMLGKMASKDLSNLSIREVEEFTGHKLRFKEKVALKVLKMKAKKMKKKAVAEMSAGKDFSAPDLEKGTYIILAILIPFVAVGLATDWEGNDWLICLLLTCLCGIPGIIYALIKMKDYYG